MSITARRLLRAKKIAAPLKSILWGAWINGPAYGQSGDAPWNQTVWDTFEQHAGKKVSIMHYGQYPFYKENFAPGVADLCTNRGAYPMMDQMIWDGETLNGQPVTLASIAAGTHDVSLTKWAQDVKAWGKPLFFRWCGEMNGGWRDYCREEIANPGIFVAAWRHMWNIVNNVGATNVTWFRCPNIEWGGPIPLAQVFPGEQYVDWTGMDGYNWGTSGNAAGTGTWDSFEKVFKETYDKILSLAPNKPLAIGEFACNEGGGSKADWVRDAFLT